MRFEYINDSIKPINQDSLLVKQGRFKKKEILLCVICDGIGGLENGHEASGLVVMAFSRWMDQFHTLKREEIQKEWEALLFQCHEQLRNKKKASGTTCSVILLIDHKYLLCHIGDSRIYFIHKKVEQLSSDHKSKTYPGYLEKAIGIPCELSFQFKKGSFKKGVLLICSDGFYKTLDERELLKLSKNFSFQIQRLTSLNRTHNEMDDISAIAVSM